MPRALGLFLKLAISVAILAWLVRDAVQADAFAALRDQPLHWPYLLAGTAVSLLAVVITIVRWHGLVRALDLPFTYRDAFRLGFLGYLFNFVSLGSVGGDLFKAAFIAREQPGRRSRAVASVFMDRLIGLYVLLVVATVGILATGQLSSQQQIVADVCKATVWATGFATAVMAMLCLPWTTEGPLASWLERRSPGRQILRQLLEALRMYRKRPGTLVVAIALSGVVHSLSTLGIYLAAQGVPGAAPSLPDHFVAVPLAMVTGILPLPMSGLGAFEGALELLYGVLGAGLGVGKGQGLLVAFAYRAMTLVIAGIALAYYLSSRRAIQRVSRVAALDVEPEESRATPVGLPT